MTVRAIEPQQRPDTSNRECVVISRAMNPCAPLMAAATANI
jgi:hypothetical protein